MKKALKNLGLTFLSLVIVFHGGFLEKSVSAVSTAQLYKEAIDFVTENGIMPEYRENDFRAEKYLTRAELLTILLKIEHSEASQRNCFNDVSQALVEAGYICRAKELGLVAGYADGRFVPRKYVNLAETLKIIFKLEGISTDVTLEGELWFEPFLAKAIEMNILPGELKRIQFGLKRGHLAEILTRLNKYDEGNLEEYLADTNGTTADYRKLLDSAIVPVNFVRSVIRKPIPRFPADSSDTTSSKPTNTTPTNTNNPSNTTNPDSTPTTTTPTRRPDTVAPTVTITAPRANANVSGSSVNVSATATDRVGVTSVEFLIDGVNVATDINSPYTMVWDTTQVANGTHTIAARAVDAAGNSGSSTALSVAVSNVVTTPPVEEPDDDENNNDASDPYSYDLGTLPSEMSINWPAPPQITRDVDVSTAAEFLAATRVAGSRIHVTQNLATRATDTAIRINGSDLEIVAEDGVRVGNLDISLGSKRLRFTGPGEFGSIRLDERLASSTNSVEDVMIDNTSIYAVGNTNFNGGVMGRGGIRVAIIKTNIECGTICVYVYANPYTPVESFDFIIAGNKMYSRGDVAVNRPEATVRLESLVRSVTVDNILVNGPNDPTIDTKSNLRYHGSSDLGFAARNVMIYTGMMSGNTGYPFEDVGRLWINDNTFYQIRPTLMLFTTAEDEHVERVTMENNVAYLISTHWQWGTGCGAKFYCGALLSGWVDNNNVLKSYPTAGPPAEYLPANW